MSEYAATIQEYVHKWDAGERCFTLDTSQRGWEFEEPIQVLALEVMRACQKLDGQDIDAFDKTFTIIYWTLREQMPRLSPVQQQNARWLAWNMMQIGPAELLENWKRAGKEDRIIVIRPPARDRTAPPEDDDDDE